MRYLMKRIADRHRRWLVGTALTGLTIIVAASVAASTARSANAKTSTSRSANAKTITLTWMDPFAFPAGDKLINGMLSDYQKTHPGVRIQRTSVNGYLVMQQKLAQQQASHTLPDVIMIDNLMTPALAKGRTIADITNYVSKTNLSRLYFHNVWQGTIYKGRNYSVPLFSDTTVMYVNTTMFEQVGLPVDPVNLSTWGKLQSAAKQLTQNGKFGLCYGASPATAGDLGYWFLPFVFQQGGSLNNPGHIANAATLAFTLFKNIMANGDTPTSVVTWSSAMTQGFIPGNCGIILDGSYNVSAATAATFKWKMVPLPCAKVCATVLGGPHLAAGNTGNPAKNKAAWDLIKWFTSKQVLPRLLKPFDFTPNRADLENPNPQYPDDVILKSVKWGHFRAPGVLGPSYSKIQDTVGSLVQSVLVGQQSPQQAGAALGAFFDKLLRAG
jgi:multiple sugar transport system substrate-binding protein